MANCAFPFRPRSQKTLAIICPHLQAGSLSPCRAGIFLDTFSRFPPTLCVTPTSCFNRLFSSCCCPLRASKRSDCTVLARTVLSRLSCRARCRLSAAVCRAACTPSLPAQFNRFTAVREWCGFQASVNNGVVCKPFVMRPTDHHPLGSQCRNGM